MVGRYIVIGVLACLIGLLEIRFPEQMSAISRFGSAIKMNAKFAFWFGWVILLVGIILIIYGILG